MGSLRLRRGNSSGKLHDNYDERAPDDGRNSQCEAAHAGHPVGEDIQQWPSGSAENAVAALRPYPAELMVAWPVGSRVNSPKNNSAELIVPKP